MICLRKTEERQTPAWSCVGVIVLPLEPNYAFEEKSFLTLRYSIAYIILVCRSHARGNVESLIALTAKKVEQSKSRLAVVAEPELPPRIARLGEFGGCESLPPAHAWVCRLQSCV